MGASVGPLLWIAVQWCERGDWWLREVRAKTVAAGVGVAEAISGLGKTHGWVALLNEMGWDRDIFEMGVMGARGNLQGGR